MNHLTRDDIAGFIDGTLRNGERSGVTAHLDTCSRCRREADVQRNIVRAAKMVPLDSPAPRFTAVVMERILQTRPTTWPARILDNLGNVFAMMVVLGIVGYAVMNPPRWTPAAAGDDPNPVATEISNAYAKAKSVITIDDALVRQWAVVPGASREQRVFLFAAVSLIALGVIDRLVVRKVRKLKT